MNNYDWLNQKTPVLTDDLKLWPENPRLNPDMVYRNLTDFADGFTFEGPDKKSFLELIGAIANEGFKPFDPIVVWKKEDDDAFYVAEGNRRVLALKLLREPQEAPLRIKRFIERQAEKIDRDTIDRVWVNVAPNFGEAQWYINQRNSTSSLQRSWTRVQQLRWVAELYDEHRGDVERIRAIAKLSQGDLEAIVRILKIKDLVLQPQVKAKLEQEEFDKASSYRFPITILERFFNSSEVKEKWGLEYEGENYTLKSNPASFLNAYAELIRRIIRKEPQPKIDTRTITSKLKAILDSLPQVSFEESDDTQPNTSGVTPGGAGSSGVPVGGNEPGTGTGTTGGTGTGARTGTNGAGGGTGAGTGTGGTEGGSSTTGYQKFKRNPNRPMMVVPIYDLYTQSYRLEGLFDELKTITYRHKNCISASLRVFLDLAVHEYIAKKSLQNAIAAEFKAEFRNVQLHGRIDYLRKNNYLTGKPQTVAMRLLNTSNEYSLDVLNGYVHGQDSHYLNSRFLNGFWDFLFPLFEALLDIRENP
jgi:hypothetical protein